MRMIWEKTIICYYSLQMERNHILRTILYCSECRTRSSDQRVQLYYSVSVISFCQLFVNFRPPFFSPLFEYFSFYYGTVYSMNNVDIKSGFLDHPSPPCQQLVNTALKPFSYYVNKGCPPPIQCQTETFFMENDCQVWNTNLIFFIVDNFPLLFIVGNSKIAPWKTN